VVFRVTTSDAAIFIERHLPQRDIELAIGALPDATTTHEDVDFDVLFEEHYVVMAGARSKWAISLCATSWKSHDRVGGRASRYRIAEQTGGARDNADRRSEGCSVRRVGECDDVVGAATDADQRQLGGRKARE